MWLKMANMSNVTSCGLTVRGSLNYKPLYGKGVDMN